MNDQLASKGANGVMPAGRPSLVRSLIKPTRGAATARRKAVSAADKTRADDPVTSLAPAALIESRLLIGAPGLLERSGAETRVRLLELVFKRLGLLLSDAIAVFRSHVGEVAASLDPGQRDLLQDLALTVRLRSDELIPHVVTALSPSQLVAVLASACDARMPDEIDALRCRELVYGGRDPLVREAMLDLEYGGSHGGVRQTLEKIVAVRLIGLLQANASVASGTIETLTARCIDSPLATTTATCNARVRLDGGSSLKDQLVDAVRQGRCAAATGLLASAAGVSRATVEAAMCLRTAKGLVSLAWRAGLDPQLSVMIQSSLGRLPPDEILRPTANGDFPLTGPEMLWQCRFLARSQHAFIDG